MALGHAVHELAEIQRQPRHVRGSPRPPAVFNAASSMASRAAVVEQAVHQLMRKAIVASASTGVCVVKQHSWRTRGRS